MRKQNPHIVNLDESELPEKDLDGRAIDVDRKTLKHLLYQSQYKSLNQGMYIAKYDSYDKEDKTYDAEMPYDQWLEKHVDEYLDDFDYIRQGDKDHFHQEMTTRYYIEEFIAQLHRKFENHQDKDSLVFVNGYEQEV